MIEVDIGFHKDVVRMVYVVSVNRDAAIRCDGMDEVIRVKIPDNLKVIGLTKHGLFSAISESKQPK